MLNFQLLIAIIRRSPALKMQDSASKLPHPIRSLIRLDKEIMIGKMSRENLET